AGRVARPATPAVSAAPSPRPRLSHSYQVTASMAARSRRLRGRGSAEHVREQARPLAPPGDDGERRRVQGDEVPACPAERQRVLLRGLDPAREQRPAVDAEADVQWGERTHDQPDPSTVNPEGRVA